MDAIRDAAKRACPNEICGILAGRRVPNGREVELVFPTANVHPDPTRQYQMDPSEQLRTLLRIEDDLGLEVIGFYHSHPAGPAELSETDRLRANWPDASYLLVWFAEVEGMGSWRWDERTATFEPERLSILEGAAYLADTNGRVVHRVGMATPSCAIAAIPSDARMEITDEHRATMVLKTRHYVACPHCWAS
jgi:proteasome lid subunit RPN8/RPN11